MTWIVIGVSSGVPWPHKEGKITFKGHEFTFRPEAEDLAPALLFKMPPGMEWEAGMTLCREFMSTLSWVDDAPLREEMVSGGGHPIKIGKGPRWQSVGIDRLHIRYLPEVTDPQAKLALALYREAHNVNSVPYKFLGFFKILNIKNQGNKHIDWINANLSKITNHEAQKVIALLQKQQKNVGEYLYGSGRCAVAHAFDPSQLVNPDDVEHQQRLQRELPIVKALAELFIEQELGVKSKRTYYKEHQYELAGFRKHIPDALVRQLDAGETIKIDPPNSLGSISIELRDRDPYPALSGLNTSYSEGTKGVLSVDCRSSDGLVSASFRLNFPANRLEFDFERDVMVNDNRSVAALEHLKDCWQFVRDLLGNGELEVNLHGSKVQLGRKDAYLPENIDFGGTYKNIEAIIARIDAGIATRSGQGGS